MNDKFENQKEKLISIKHEISLLYQQVNYLIRNEKALELLDLDVLMNRTHTLYDQLCSINLSENIDEDDLPFDAEGLSGIFGSLMQEETPTEIEKEPKPESEALDSEQETAFDEQETLADLFEEPVVVPAEKDSEDDAIVGQSVEEDVKQSSDVIVDQAEDVVVVQPIEEVIEQHEETQPVVNVEPAHEPVVDEKPLGDEFGFFFRFEDMPEEEAPAVPSPEPIVAENKVVHVMEEIPEEEIPERDRVHGDDLVKDNPLEMPQVEDEPVENELFDFEKPETGNMSGFFENDDSEFEFSTSETLGEKMMHEDHSLAAKLQQNPHGDLKSAIGINDKFLFVNELFGGSMEKYNKSIENLNDLKTLNGAMIYLNELKIELQWNSSNEAYQKLKELVSRKFE